MNFIRFVYILLATVYLAYSIPHESLPVNESYDDCDSQQPLFLTNYIISKQFTEAKRLAIVNNKEMNDIATSYAAYLTVNAKFNGNIFFWYFPAASLSSDAPVVLWLNGGPGESSLRGLFTANGPFIVNANMTLSAREFSWHMQHHLIYFDNPVGAGFSFTDTGGYVRNEEEVGRDLYEALQQFFALFSELRSNRFYITGLSYAGKYIPALSYTILKRNMNANEVLKINLIGMSIGNGWTDPVHQLNYAEHLYQLGLVDANGYQLIATIEAKCAAYIHNQDYESAYNIFYKEFIIAFFKLTRLTSTSFENYINPDDMNMKLIVKFIQLAKTKRAIHVGNNTFHSSSIVEKYLKLDVFQSVANLMSELLSHYKVQLYNGQVDILVAYPTTVNYLKHLQFNGYEEYRTAKRTIWRIDGEIAGYMKVAGNLTEVLVRNAGHYVLYDQPKWGLNLLMRLTHGVL